MQPERWRRIEKIYHAAREHDPNSRRDFLTRACGSDDQLREQVEALLKQDSMRSGVLDRPPHDLLDDLTRTAVAPGTQLGPYRIEALLGHGGMGEVFRAVDQRLNRHVAIKICQASIGGRFSREAQAIAALNHPHICTLHDVGPNYLVMELVEGETLSECLRKGPVQVSLVLRYAIEIADAISAAHERGIVHRDLKPGNIMISRSGIKVLDFGLVKLLRPSSAGRNVDSTETGAVVGTAAYMSPEQAEGRELDERSDIFSFGLVLYEIATGRQAFTGDSRLSILTRIVKEDPPPPRQVAPSIPLELEEIILRCIRKLPADRCQTMAEVKHALETIAALIFVGQPKPAVVSRPSPKLIWTALMPVVLVIAFIAWREWRSQQVPESLTATALTTMPGAELFPSLSPDGNQVAYSWNGSKQDNHDIWVQMIGGAGTPLRLTTDPANDYNPVWSPDGQWIAFLRTANEHPFWAPTGRQELRLIGPLGGPERLLAEVMIRQQYVAAPRLAWCPDSKCLMITGSPGEAEPDALFLVSLETGEKRQLTQPQLPVAGDSNPAISPDGHSLIFRRNIGFITGELYSLALAEGFTPRGQPTRLTPFTLDAGFPTWMPDGKEILFSAKHGLYRLAPQAGKTPARLPFVGEDGVMPVVSVPRSSGKPRLVYVRNQRDFNIWQIGSGADGSWQAISASPISSTRPDTSPDFSPDGQKVVFDSDRSGDSEIWIASVDGSNPYRLTSMGASDTGTARWSPDGQWIAFDSNLEGHYEVYVVSASGGKPRRLTSHTAHSQLPGFSRDGKWVYFSSNRGGEFQIWKVPFGGGEVVQVTQNGAFGAWESYDAASVYYWRPNHELWKIPVSGGQPVKIEADVMFQAVVPLRDGLFYLQRNDGGRLQFLDFAAGKSRTLARRLGNLLPGMTVSPDRRTVLYTRLDSTDADLMLVENFK